MKRLGLSAAVLLCLGWAGGASAQLQVCTRNAQGNLLSGHREMHWPASAPVWDFCFVRPACVGIEYQDYFWVFDAMVCFQVLH